MAKATKTSTKKPAAKAVKKPAKKPVPKTVKKPARKAASTNGAARNTKSTARKSARSAKPDAAAPNPLDQLDPEVLAKLAEIRTKIHETFGQVALAMAALPRYRNLTIGDLTHLVLEPMMRDRVAIAAGGKKDDRVANPLSGIAIWASVSEDVDARIREQIKAGVFPVRLQADEWTSGDINWLFDVIAPNAKLATSVIANFKQVIKEGDMRIHPLVTKLVDPEALKKMGASPI